MQTSTVENCFHYLFSPNPRIYIRSLRPQMALPGYVYQRFFPNALCCGRGSNPRQQSCTDPGPFEGPSTNWATAPRQEYGNLKSAPFLKMIRLEHRRPRLRRHGREAGQRQSRTVTVPHEPAKRRQEVQARDTKKTSRLTTKLSTHMRVQFRSIKLTEARWSYLLIAQIFLSYIEEISLKKSNS